MSNLPTTPVIAPADGDVEGTNSGMNAGGSDSCIGICTDNPNPKAVGDWPRIVVGATRNPIGHPQTDFQYAAEYGLNAFTGSPVGFAPADTQAAPGEVYATNVNGTGWDLKNKTHSYTTEVGDWLWGIVGGGDGPGPGPGPGPDPGPDPAPLTVIYESGINHTGYGQDRYIAVGSTTSEILINPEGHGPLQYSTDLGDTWTPISWSSDTSTRICQDMHVIGSGASAIWYILGYREDNRADRIWYEEGIPDGTWTFTNNEDLSYNHGVYYEGSETIFRYDGNNNGPGRLSRYENQPSDGNRVVSALNPNSGQRNPWVHRRAGPYLYITHNYLGVTDGYMVWNINDNPPTHVGTYDGVLNKGNSCVTDGSVVICTATANEGGTTGNSGIIQTLSIGGTVTDSFMDFGTPVTRVCCHFENNKFIITATVDSDLTKIRYGFGTSGTYFGEIDLPYIAATNDNRREVRYLGDNLYAVGYLASIGGDSVLVVFTIGLE